MARRGNSGTMVSLYVTGDAELDRQLKAMPESLQQKYLAKAAEISIKKIVLPRARQRAPMSDPAKKKRRGQPGDLRRGFKAYRMRARRGSVGWKLHVGAPGYHAPLIELGTEERFTTSGAARGKIDKPSRFAFLRDALYVNEQQIRAKYTEFVKAFIAAGNAKIKNIKHLLSK